MKSLTLALCLALMGAMAYLSLSSSEARPDPVGAPSVERLMQLGKDRGAHVNSGACSCTSCRAIRGSYANGYDFECSCKGEKECKVTVAASEAAKALSLATLDCQENPACGN